MMYSARGPRRHCSVSAQSARCRSYSPPIGLQHRLPRNASQCTCKDRLFPIATPRSQRGTTRAASPVKFHVPKESDGSGSEVQVGGQRYRCLSVLGKGSYGKVWLCETIGDSRRQVALKEVTCLDQRELDQALAEVRLLKAFEEQIPDSLQIPRCISYSTQRMSTKFCLKMTLSVCPGETLDSFLKKNSTCLVEKCDAFQYALGLVARLMEDIGKIFEKISSIATHRDVNSHNIMVKQNSWQPTDVSFWLIDFGLAVDSIRWDADRGPGSWAESWCSGDVRYWPPSSWMICLCGVNTLRSNKALCAQYRRGLDVYGLGITALEIICLICLVERKNMSPCSVDSCLDTVLLMRWRQYWDDVSRWWSALRAVNNNGGMAAADVKASFIREGCLEKVMAHIVFLRKALQATMKGCSNQAISSLIHVMAQMINENANFGWKDLSEHLACCSWESLRSKSPAFESPNHSTAYLGNSCAGGVQNQSVSTAILYPSSTYKDFKVTQEWLVEEDAALKSQEELRLVQKNEERKGKAEAEQLAKKDTRLSLKCSLGLNLPELEDAKAKMTQETMRITAPCAMVDALRSRSIDQLEIATGKGVSAVLEPEELEPAMRMCKLRIAEEELRLEKEEVERKAKQEERLLRSEEELRLEKEEVERKARQEERLLRLEKENEGFVKEEVELKLKIEKLQLAVEEEERMSMVKAEAEQRVKEAIMAKEEEDRLAREKKERQAKDEAERLAKGKVAARARLENSAKSRDSIQHLQQALAEGQAAGLQPSELQVQEAEKVLAQEKRKVAARARLASAVKSRDAKDLKEALAEGGDAGLRQHEMAATEKVLAEEERKIEARARLEKKLWLEKEEQESKAKAEMERLEKEEEERKTKKKAEQHAKEEACLNLQCALDSSNVRDMEAAILEGLRAGLDLPELEDAKAKTTTEKMKIARVEVEKAERAKSIDPLGIAVGKEPFAAELEAAPSKMKKLFLEEHKGETLTMSQGALAQGTGAQLKRAFDKRLAARLEAEEVNEKVQARFALQRSRTQESVAQQKVAVERALSNAPFANARSAKALGCLRVLETAAIEKGKSAGLDSAEIESPGKMLTEGKLRAVAPRVSETAARTGFNEGLQIAADEGPIAGMQPQEVKPARWKLLSAEREQKVETRSGFHIDLDLAGMKPVSKTDEQRPLQRAVKECRLQKEQGPHVRNPVETLRAHVESMKEKQVNERNNRLEKVQLIQKQARDSKDCLIGAFDPTVRSHNGAFDPTLRSPTLSETLSNLRNSRPF